MSLSKFKLRKKLKPFGEERFFRKIEPECLYTRLTIFHVHQTLVSEDKDVEDRLTEREEGTVSSHEWPESRRVTHIQIPAATQLQWFKGLATTQTYWCSQFIMCTRQSLAVL